MIQKKEALNGVLLPKGGFKWSTDTKREVVLIQEKEALNGQERGFK